MLYAYLKINNINIIKRCKQQSAWQRIASKDIIIGAFAMLSNTTIIYVIDLN